MKLRLTRRMAIILILGQVAMDITFTIYIVADQLWQDSIQKIIINMLMSSPV